VISVVRDPDELSVLINQRASDREADTSFETTSVPLTQIKRSVYPAKDRLQESWRYLSEVKAVDAETLYHVLVVLLETVPNVSSDEIAEPLPREWDAAPVPIRATQANPRAFKGTKYQPPKARRLSQTDTRPHLCDARALKALFSPLRKFLAAIRPRLAKVGYTVAALDAVEDELRPDPRRNVPWSLPAQFVPYLWPSVRQKPWRDRSRLLSLFSGLEMEADPRLLAAFTRLVAIDGAEAGCLWGRISEVLPAHRRAIFIEKLIETGAYSSTPKPDIARRAEETSLLATHEEFPLWLEQLLLVTKKELSADYLLAGFRLAAQFNPKHRFEDIGHCANFPEQVVEELGIQLDDSEWLALALWERCGKLPRLADLIRQSQWRSFSPSAAYGYFRFLVGIVYYDLTARALQKKWAAIAECIPQIEALVLATSAEYQEKLVECISDWLSWWDDPAAIRKRLPRGYQILRRLAAPPFQTGEDADRAIMYFLELENEDDLRRFLAAPNTCFQSLEAACRRDNDAVLIARGLEQLISLQGRFTVDAFLAEPGRLCRSAKMLGSVSAPVRSQLVRECQAHPFFQIDPLKTPIRELCAEIVAHRGGRQENPIPARLSLWLRGEIELSQVRLERYQRVLSARFMLTRLNLIEESVVDWLKRGFPASQITKAGEHALRLLGTLRENRRGLRKFLNAYWAGDGQYLPKHPATLAWYRKHKTVSRNLWEEGISFQSDQFSIQVERDPFEVLKLGTYVGSCFAIGGMCSDSPVAALLDANKRVLYARDHRKRVVARQLIAISDEDRLVCFSVYPLSAGKQIKGLFREYDRTFAEALNLPLYEPTETGAGYEVSSVLSVYWWDDMSWDFKVSD
jgi:hypothetical protein